MKLHDYATLIFDCDGVVLDSNCVKTEAFRAAALPWCAEAAEALVAHHVANGGVSRYAKFAHFIERILPDYAPGAVPGRDGPDLHAMLTTYAEAARAGLMSCTVAEGLAELRAAKPDSRWMIVSGGDEAELREIFRCRQLDRFFDGGIFGSPDAKDEILAREKARGNIVDPALFLGDSRYDLEAARRASLEFLFVSGWSELSDWEEFVARSGVQHTDSVESLASDLKKTS